jgi:hypothetical protein
MRMGSITTDIISDGLAFNFDIDNRASYIPNATNILNTKNLNTSGSLTNGAAYSNTAPTSIDLDGSDDYLEFTNITSSLNLSSGTMDIWFKPHDTTGWKYLISTGNSAVTWNANHYHVSYNHDSQKLGVFSYGSSTDTDDTIGNGAFTENNIHNFVVTSTGKTFVNGVEEANGLSGTWFDNPDVINHFRIGTLTMNGAVYGAQKTNGNIYNFKIYNRALSATEVLHNYNALKGRFGL